LSQRSNFTRKHQGHELGIVRGLPLGCATCRLGLEHLAQHVLQDSAVLVVLDFLRSVDAN
jgi:hypothetical protein